MEVKGPPNRRQRRLKNKHVLDPFLLFHVYPLNPVVLLGKKRRKALKRGEWPCLERKAEKPKSPQYLPPRGPILNQRIWITLNGGLMSKLSLVTDKMNN